MSRLIEKPVRMFQRAQDMLERRIRNEHEEVNLQPSRYWAKAITWYLVGGSVFGLVWLSFAQTEEIVVAPGKLEPIGSVKDVQMPLQGVAKEILVKDGETVKEGQVLIRLDTEVSRRRYENTLQALRLRRTQLSLKEQELSRTNELGESQLNTLEGTLQLNKEILSRYVQLARQGATAELQYLEQKNRVEDLRGQIEKTKVDTIRQGTILSQDIQSLKTEITQLNSTLTELAVTLRYQDIKAPTSGVVFDLKPKSPGFVAQGSEPVLKIVPGSKLLAKVEIPSSNIGFVSVGKPVDISIDSFPASDFGVLHGSIKRIGSDALAPDPMNNKIEYRYPTDIEIKNQTLVLKDGSKLPLQVGMSLTANIKLRKVTYLQLLLGEFKDKADSLRRL